MLAEVAGKADELADERREPRARVARGVEPRFGQPRRQILHVVSHVDHAGDRLDAVEREAEHLGEIADGRPQPIRNHFGRHCRAGATVGVVDVLQHLLAAVVLEVDVDVRRLPPLAAHKPLEEHVHPRWIHRRDPEAVADAGVGRRAAALAENAAAAGEPHDVEHREEIGLVAEFGDKREFVLEQPLHLLRHALGIPFVRALPGEVGEMFSCSAAGGHDGVGVFVFEFVERKRAAGGDLGRSLHGGGPEESPTVGIDRAASCGQRGEPPGDPPPLVEVPLAVGQERLADRLDRLALPHRREGIEERQPRPLVVADIARGHERHTRLLGHLLQPCQAVVVIAFECHLGERPEPVAKHVAPPRKAADRIAECFMPLVSSGAACCRHHRAGEQARRVHRDVIERHHTTTRASGGLLDPRIRSRCPRFGPPHMAAGEQAAEVGVAGMFGGPEHERRRVDGLENRAHDQFQRRFECRVQPEVFRGGMRPHDTGERAPVGDRQRLVAEGMRPPHEFLGM